MDRSHKSLIISWWRSFIGSWIDFIQGLVGIVTIGLYRPYWDMMYTCYITKKDMSEKMKGKMSQQS